VRIVSRAEWGSAGKVPAAKMVLPARELVLHHTVTPVSANAYADMRAVERAGIARFGHISYSFCIHPDGTILEGCGTRVGAHTAGRNSTAFGVALIGNYEDRAVKVQQLDAIRWLIADLIARSLLRSGTYPTSGHRDLVQTACPGTSAYRLLDMMRIPWSAGEQITPKEPNMADDPGVPNITGPLTFHPIVSADGMCTGYYVFSPSTGEVHGHGPGAPYYGRSEDSTPG